MLVEVSKNRLLEALNSPSDNYELLLNDEFLFSIYKLIYTMSDADWNEMNFRSKTFLFALINAVDHLPEFNVRKTEFRKQLSDGGVNKDESDADKLEGFTEELKKLC